MTEGFLFYTYLYIMIVIDKSLTANTIYVTCTEVTPLVSSGCTLTLFDLYTNVTTVLNLGPDTSPYPERYNQYRITSPYSGLSVTKYSFVVKNSGNTICEEGICEVVNSVLTPEQQVDNQYVFKQPTATDDDFIVFQ